MELDLTEALRALAASAPAAALRASRYAYPLVNALHILGLATLFGAILALDLRLLGLGRAVPLAPLAGFLPRIAAAGIVVSLVSGIALFSVQPVEYAANGAFRLKLIFVSCGVTHAFLVHRSTGWKKIRNGAGTTSIGLRLSAGVSLALWTGAILAGRFIGFE